MNVYWMLEVKVNDGKLGDLKSLMDQMVQTSKDEPGTLAYDWTISEDEKTVHILEHYKDADAVMAHMGGFAQVAGKFMECVTPAGLVIYGKADEKIRAAMAGLNPVYMNPLGGF